MADREKVIRALQCRSYNDDVSCKDCAYFRPGNKPTSKCDWEQAFEDAIELLKKQEAVQPLYTTTSHPFHVGLLYSCGNCHEPLERDRDLFCRRCGKPVDWEKGAVKWE